jgi:hypothetical protein
MIAARARSKPRTDELVIAPDTGSLRLFRLVKVGRQLDLLGLIHVSF